jgi:Fe-S-cluster containining protein
VVHFTNVPVVNGYGIVCSFMDQDTGMCSIYDERPLICRTFPIGCYGCLEVRKNA